MKQISFSIFFTTIITCLFLLQNSFAQEERTLGDWQAHLSYGVGRTVAQSSDKVYVGTDRAMFSYNKYDGQIQNYTKIDGLSEMGIACLAHHPAKEILLIAYDNTNIDLLKDNSKIVNISGIRRSNIIGGKKIYDVLIQDDFAYIACGFGIVVLDLEKEQIKDTYFFTEDGQAIVVNQLAISEEGRILAATENGLYEASLSNPGLSDFSEWKRPELWKDTEIKNVVYNGDAFIINIGDALYEEKKANKTWDIFYKDDDWCNYFLSNTGETLTLIQYKDSCDSYTNRVTLINKEGNTEFRTYWEMIRPTRALFDNGESGRVWVADIWRGLLVSDLGEGNGYRIVPEGPGSNSIFDVVARDGKIWIAPGGVEANWFQRYNNDGFFYFHDEDWANFNQYNTDILSKVQDMVTIAVHPTKDIAYFGSYQDGMVEYKEGQVKVYGKENTTLQGNIAYDKHILVSGLSFDHVGNLWIANARTNEPISVMSEAGEWLSFKPKINVPNNTSLHNLIIDHLGQKWMAIYNYGILVFNHGPDLYDTSDDQYKILKSGEGSGNLPVVNIKSMAIDKDGAIWVGTVEGVAVFYCTYNVFGEGGCDAILPYLEVDGYGANLLETETVWAIAVDGANRKWFGTENGVFLMSPDGSEQIAYYNENNSPLLSNVITSIDIDGSTGIVYIGTDKGLVSFKSDALEGDDTHDEQVLVYPNPVHPDYQGDIAIRGLPVDANVKITDVSGNLVYETKALGSQAIWNGKDYNGQKAVTGVYLIFTSNSDNKDNFVSKVLIVNE